MNLPRKNIRVATLQSSLGAIFAASTHKGICALSFCNTKKGMKQIRRSHPQSFIQINDPRLKKILQKIAVSLQNKKAFPPCPLDLNGTPFQKDVWKTLLKIPSGKTRSYAEIARSIGKPKAARAVGNACAQNPVALLIPCHRVIGSNHRLGGYAWGLPMKKQLLKMERL